MQKVDGRYIKELREEHGLSLRAFADKIYVSKSSVQRWEKSSVPENPEILEKISQVFGVTIQQMRESSAEKYGAKQSDDGLTPDERAEAKFGIKGLIAAVVAAGVILVAVILFFML